MFANENTYVEFMNETVLPCLNRKVHKGILSADDGLDLYYEYYLAKHPKGAIVICHGFTECSQKYKEMIYYFLRGGYHVFIMDCRGHGYSGRAVENLHKVYVGSFQDYINDLHKFINAVVRPRTSCLELFLYAHSMGGAIGAAYVEQYPADFKKAVLNAPMIRMKTASIPEWSAFAIAAVMHFTGHGRDFVPGQKQSIEGECYETSASHSRARFEYYLQRRLGDPMLQTCGSTFDWLYHNIIGTHRLTSRRCRAIATPLMIFMSDNDTCVKNTGIIDFVRKIRGNGCPCRPAANVHEMPPVRLYLVKNTRHEIYSSDSLAQLRAYYRKIFQFLED